MLKSIFFGILTVSVCIYITCSRFSYDAVDQLGTYFRSSKISKTFGAAVKSDIFDYCPFTALDPWHESVAKYVDVKYGFNKECDSIAVPEQLTILKEKKVILKSKEKYDCKGRCIYYVSDRKYKTSDWVSIRNATYHCDFVETECKKENLTDRFVHMQIEEKSSPSDIKLSREIYPDVHIFVIDSVASSHFMRALPRTANFLANGLSAIQFRKLNKVGVNSRPNAFVTLLGKTTEPMERKVMNLDDIKADFSYEELCHTYLDNETYIPSEYHKAGYKTLDLQDYVASALNYPNCKGIKNNSLDHYYRAFHLRLRSDKELFNTLRQSRCRSSPDYMLDYFSLFLDSYKNYPKFSFTWIVELAHGNGEWLYAGDYALYNFFFTNRRRLSNSFIFFFGDHGARLGREAHTSLGVSELNNPFLYIAVPERLRHTPIYNQLQKNSEDVITHHDLYATFMDILYFQPASNFTDLEFKKYGNHMKGSSLLRHFEPGVLRNCKTLPIPFQYCICQYGKERVNDTVLLDKLGNFVIDRLISLLQYHNVSSQCEQITLKKVEALKYTAPDADSLSIEASIFDVIFEVSQPAKGKFKIPVRKEKDMLIAGEVFERLNRYGHNGDCMDKDFLRPLCTCKSSLESSTKQSTGTSTRKVLQTITRRRKGKT